MWDYTKNMLTVRKNILGLWFKNITVHSVAKHIFSSHALKFAGAEAAVTDRTSLLQNSTQPISQKIN